MGIKRGTVPPARLEALKNIKRNNDNGNPYSEVRVNNNLRTKMVRDGWISIQDGLVTITDAGRQVILDANGGRA